MLKIVIDFIPLLMFYDCGNGLFRGPYYSYYYLDNPNLKTNLLSYLYFLRFDPSFLMIPMTIVSKKFMKSVGTKDEKQHIAFGVCALIFCGLIGLVAGILVLIASANFNKQNLS